MLNPKIIFHVLASILYAVTIEILSSLQSFSIIRYAGACLNFVNMTKKIITHLRICV